MGDKGSRCGATGDGVQHWSLDLDEEALSQELTNKLNGRCTNTKNLAHLWIHNQIYIALPIP